jgi:superfamily II DNA or RNA helicase
MFAVGMERIRTNLGRRGSQVLFGTIVGEGVDMPELAVVINAEGVNSRVAVMRRLRNIPGSEGKWHAVVIDFADIGQCHLREHASDRLD